MGKSDIHNAKQGLFRFADAKLVPVGLKKKIIMASCSEHLGGAHNL